MNLVVWIISDLVQTNVVRRICSEGVGTSGYMSGGGGSPRGGETAVQSSRNLLIGKRRRLRVRLVAVPEVELKKVEESTRNNRTPEKTTCALHNSLQWHNHSHLIAE